jgi:transcriptional regulator with PAS, ATPase and Fis domain
VVTASDLAFPQENPQGETSPAPEGTSYTLKQMNQLYLQRVLAQTNGDKAQAAKILNINLSTLYRWERAKG